MKTRQALISTSLILLGVIILLNILSDRMYFRLDLTDNKQYTLSKATKDIVKDLDEPVTVIAYFSEKVPPQLTKVKREFKDLLTEYRNRSRGMVNFRIVNPDKSEEAKEEARKDGIQQQQIYVVEKDQQVAKNIFFGAIIKVGETKKDTIPFLNPQDPMEFTLSSGIKKLTTSIKPQVGVIQGHGEASIKSYDVVKQILTIFDLVPVKLLDTIAPPNLSQYKSLMLVAPKDSLDPAELNMLDQYLEQGGNLLIAYNTVQYSLSQEMGLQQDMFKTGVEGWLAAKGVTIEENIIADKQHGNLSIPIQFFGQRAYQQRPFQYFPLVNKFEEHPITKNLEQIVFRIASSMKFAGDTSKYIFEPIVKTSNNSYAQPLYFGPRDLSEQQLRSPGFTIGATLKYVNNNQDTARIVIFSDADFASTSEEGLFCSEITIDNFSLMGNAIEWLSDQTGLVDLRTKSITSRPIDPEISDEKRMLIKYSNFFLPIILIIVFGLIRMQTNRNKRYKRMEENYV